MERIRMIRKDDEPRSPSLQVTIRVRLRPRRVFGLLAGLAALALLGGCLAPILQEGLQAADSGAEWVFGVAMLAFPAAVTTYFLWKVLWSLCGKERLLIRRESLSVRHSLGPLRLTRSYSSPGPPPESSGAAPAPSAPIWEKLTLERDRSSVFLSCNEGRIPIVEGLDKAEAVYLVTAIRVLMRRPGEPETRTS